MTKHFCDFCNAEQKTPDGWKLLKVCEEMEVCGTPYQYQLPSIQPIRVCLGCYQAMESSFARNYKPMPYNSFAEP